MLFQTTSASCSTAEALECSTSSSSKGECAVRNTNARSTSNSRGITGTGGARAFSYSQQRQQGAWQPAMFAYDCCIHAAVSALDSCSQEGSNTTSACQLSHGSAGFAKNTQTAPVPVPPPLQVCVCGGRQCAGQA